MNGNSLGLKMQLIFQRPQTNSKDIKVKNKTY